MDWPWDHTLWKTRGREWDFEFLLLPLGTGIPAWYRIWSQMFKATSDSRDGIQRRFGVFELGPRLGYAATMLLDPEGRRDAAGRPIFHQLALVTTDGEPPCLPADWATTLLHHAKPEYDRVFGWTGKEAPTLEIGLLPRWDIEIPEGGVPPGERRDFRVEVATRPRQSLAGRFLRWLEG